MLISLNDISKYSVEATDLSPSLDDIWLDRIRLNAHAVTLDIGGWLSDKLAIVGTKRIAAIDSDERSITISLSKKEAEAGIDLNAHLTEARRVPPSVVDWSKPMSATGKDTITEGIFEGLASYNPTGAAEPGAIDLVRLSHILSADVFGSDGEIGRAIDLLVAPDTLQIRHLVVDTGTFLAERQIVVPIGLLSHFASKGNHTVLRTTREQVENSPPLEEFGAQDRNWID